MLLLESMPLPKSQINPVALITGASRGIGRGIALELTSLGYDLALNFRSDAEAAAKTARDCLARAASERKSVSTSLYRADISVAADREHLVSRVQADFGRLDLLVNNAGIAPANRADLLDATEESFDRLIAVNLKGPFFLTQLAARWMLQLREKLGATYQGKIVTISSISAYAASINRGDYCIAKAGLSMLTPLFAARLAAAGIYVYEIRPGIIGTDMTAGVKEKYDALIAAGLTPIPRWGEPRDVGKAVAAIAQGSFPFSTGEVINVDGGFHIRIL
jgi:NAD(P)-dependent dehydrogenase (short-subunit alcohol dehydrogenase family)